MLVRWWSVLQNQETKSLSRSEMMLSGSLFSQYHILKKRWAMSSAITVDFVGAILMSEPDLSVNVMIVSNPWSLGSGLMRLMATESQRWLGMGRGWRGPMG